MKRLFALTVAVGAVLFVLGVGLAGCGDDNDSGNNTLTGNVVPNDTVSLGYFKNQMPDGRVLECVYGRNAGSISCNWEEYNAG